MKHILLGGSGFIGTALAHALVKQGDEVISVSRTGANSMSGVTNHILDCTTQPCPPNLFDGAQTVFILLGQNHRDFNADLERKAIQNVAHALKNTSSRVFYFSSTLVYGHTEQPATEYTESNPVDPYSAFKREAEETFQAHVPADRLTILRLSNIYGTPKNKGFIGLLMQKLLEPNPSVTLNGDGEQQRDYLFVDDLLVILLRLQQQLNLPETLNIATGTSTSLKELVALASKLAKKPIHVTVSHAPTNEAHDNQVAISRLRDLIGDLPLTDIATGLALTQKRYQENL